MSDRSPRQMELCRGISEGVEALVDDVFPFSGTRIVTDVYVLVARQEFNDDGSTASLVTGLPMDENMPDYRAVGLIESLRDTYRGGGSGD